VVSTLGTTKVCGWVERGCPQGGVLSPLLWCLVADGLLEELLVSNKGFHVQGYADDMAILVRRAFLEPLLELTQGVLQVVEKWCQGTGLSVNPAKTGIVIFTCKYKDSFVRSIFGGVRLSPSGAVKYLGVTLEGAP